MHTIDIQTLASLAALLAGVLQRIQPQAMAFINRNGGAA